MHIIFENVLVVFTKSYQNYSMLVETIACQIWRVLRIFVHHKNGSNVK